MTDRELALIAQELYSAINPLCIGGITYSVTETDTEWILCPRGSKSPQEWLQDFMALPVWTKLGMVHSGGWMGVEALYAVILPLARTAIAASKKIRITGHSLGGGHGHLIAGLFILDGIMPDLVTFAAPRFAWENLGRIFEKSGIVCRNYRFRRDPVPMVAPFPYELAMPLTKLDGPTDSNDFANLRDHSITHYISSLPPAPPVSAQTPP